MIVNPKLPIPLDDIVGLDLETNGNKSWKDEILVIAIRSGLETYVLERAKYSKKELAQLFSDISEKLVVGHNLSFDCGFIFNYCGIQFENIWDTMLVSQILSNGLNHPHDLDSTIERYLNIQFRDAALKKFYQKSFIGLKVGSTLSYKQLDYAGKDTEYLIPLMAIQKLEVVEKELDKVVKLEHALLPVIMKMEVRGCAIDVNAWRGAIAGWDDLRDRAVEALDFELQRLSSQYNKLPRKMLKKRVKRSYEVLDLFSVGEIIIAEDPDLFNYGSPKQIGWLFSHMGAEMPMKVDGETKKVSFDEDTLRTYLTENPKSIMRPFVELLLRYREYEKLISTYGEGFLKKVDNGYIHTYYSQCFTDTGRLSSRNPNLQNIPATDLEKDGYDIRRYFVADPGQYMITCDMDAAEVRIAADYSQEPKLVSSILDDEDLHSKLASISYSIIFGEKVKIDKSNDMLKVGDYEFRKRELRDTHKSVLFAKFYKGGAKRVYGVLAEYINLFHSPEDRMVIADKISKAMDKQLPILSKYLSSLIDDAKINGMLRGSKLGRIRYFDSNVYGEAANFPVQNTNGEALKVAMIKLDRYFQETGCGRLVMNIHDEVVCSVDEAYLNEAATMISKIMGESLGWFLKTIPGKASVARDKEGNVIKFKHWKK